MGLLHLLDEECAIQKGSDDNFALKLRERHAKNKYFEAPKREQSNFLVKHYAGDVTYVTRGFREKNKDALHPDLAAVMQASQSAFVRELFPIETVSAVASTKAMRKGKSSDRMTVGAQFMSQLASLMRTINATGVHYVRCIKPNTANKPRLFDAAHSAHQLRCAGVLEAVRISRMAYPNRMPHAAFVKKYALLAGKEWQQAHVAGLLASRDTATADGGPAAELCADALKQVVEDETRYQLGKTKVFFRAFLLESLEKRRSTALSERAVLLQKYLRGLFWRRRFLCQRDSAVRIQTARRTFCARAAYTKKLRAVLLVAACARGMQARTYARRLRAAVRIEAAVRALLSRRSVYAFRRMVRATHIQAEARRRSRSRRFSVMRKAALRVQSRHRMLAQRKQYRRDLADKKEEAKLSTQIARLQAQLQAEMEARKHAELEQERLKAERLAAPSASAGEPAAPSASAGQPAAPSASAGQPAAPSASAGEAPSLGAGESQPATGAALAEEAAAHAAAEEAGTSISGRLAGAAAKYLLPHLGQAHGTTSSIEETSAMLSLVTKDREKLSQKLATETEARKRLEAEKRELERKLRLGSATSQLESRKNRDVGEALSRKKDELGEMRQMLQHQAQDIANLHASKAVSDKRIIELEKKISQYDDSFYALEARNVRDRTKMEEMAKAKNQAEEEKNVYRLMLEQAHGRALKERQELRRDAQSKIEASAARIRMKQQRIVQLEKTLREKADLEEEVKMYREQNAELMMQLSATQQSTTASPRGRAHGIPAAAGSPANLLSEFSGALSKRLQGRPT